MLYTKKLTMQKPFPSAYLKGNLGSFEPLLLQNIRLRTRIGIDRSDTEKYVSTRDYKRTTNMTQKLDHDCKKSELVHNNT